MKENCDRLQQLPGSRDKDIQYIYPLVDTNNCHTGINLESSRRYFLFSFAITTT